MLTEKISELSENITTESSDKFNVISRCIWILSLVKSPLIADTMVHSMSICVRNLLRLQEGLEMHIAGTW